MPNDRPSSLSVTRIVTGMFQENTWHLRCPESGQCALVDPGEGILDHLRKLGFESLGIHHVLLTHAHLDHVWGLRDVKSRWPDARIVMHPDDVWLLRALPDQGSMVGLGVRLPPPPEPDELVSDSATVRVGGFEATVIHTPGHTQGGICYHFAAESKCFVGDMVIAGSIGRTDLPGGDPSVMEASLRRIMALPVETRLYGGHGPALTLEEELETNAVLPVLASGRSLTARGMWM